MFYVVSKENQKTVLEQAHDNLFVLNHLPVPPFTPDEVIQRGLLFAKSEPTDEELAKAAVFYQHKGVATGSLSDYFEQQFRTNLAELQTWWDDMQLQRTEFRSRLAELMRAPQKAIRKSKKDLRLLNHEVLIACGIDETTGELTHRFFPMTEEAGYKYVLQKLCMNNRWKRLKQCARSECRTVFFRQPSTSGGRPRDYCTRQCQLTADGKNALQRQKEQRKKKRLRGKL